MLLGNYGGTAGAGGDNTTFQVSVVLPSGLA